VLLVSLIVWRRRLIPQVLGARMVLRVGGHLRVCGTHLLRCARRIRILVTRRHPYRHFFAFDLVTGLGVVARLEVVVAFKSIGSKELQYLEFHLVWWRLA